ncbi:hypothetical protein JCM5296_005714 [Sporobolomyces johnsonii]
MSLGRGVGEPMHEVQAQEVRLQPEPPLALPGNATVTVQSDEVMKEQQRIKEVEFKLDQERTLPCYRQIAGPSYSIHDEIDITAPNHVAQRERRWRRLHPPSSKPERKGYRVLYEQMVFEANTREFPFDRIPSIRVIREKADEPTPSPTEWWSPLFEIGYTNCILYANGIVPDQAPGCVCVSNCSDPANRGGCACRAQQVTASRTRPGGGERSGHQDFAYDENGVIDERVLKLAPLVAG